MTLKHLIIIYLSVLFVGWACSLLDTSERQLIIVAPVYDPQRVYYCNAVTWKYGVKYATKCNVKKVFRFDDSRYLFGYEPI